MLSEILRIKMEAVRMSEWISVKDRLPKNGQDILAYSINGEKETRIVPANYDHDVWYDCIFNHVMHNGCITHWMPLPDPPEVTGDV